MTSAAPPAPERTSRGRVASALALGIAASTLGFLVAAQPVPVLAALLVIGVALAMAASPDAVTQIVVLVFFTNAAGVAVKLHGAPPVIGLAVILLLVLPLAYHLGKGRRLVVTPGFIALVLLLVVQLLSTIVAVDVYRSWENVQTFMIEGVLLYFLLTNVVRTPEALRRMLWVVIASGALLGGLSLFQQATGTFARPYGGFAQVPSEFLAGYADKARLAGPIGDPNYYAQILLVAVTLALFMIWSERRGILRVAAVAAVILSAAGILLSFSRGAGLAFFVILMLMAFLRAIRPRYVVAVVIGLVIALGAVPAYTERIATVTSIGAATSVSGTDSAADESVRSRMTEMLAAAYVFGDHPVLGVGPGNFPLYYQDYAERIGIELRERVKFGPRRGEEPQRESHNMFLSIAAELGLLGLVAFLAVIWTTARSLLRARRRWLGVRTDLANMATALLLGIVAYVMTGFFLTLAFERYFWLLLALGGAAAHVLRTLPEPGAAAADAETPSRGETRPGRRARSGRERATARGSREPRASRVAVPYAPIRIHEAPADVTRERAPVTTARGVGVPPLPSDLLGERRDARADDGAQPVRYFALAGLALALILFGLLLVTPEMLLDGF